MSKMYPVFIYNLNGLNWPFSLISCKNITLKVNLDKRCPYNSQAALSKHSTKTTQVTLFHNSIPKKIGRDTARKVRAVVMSLFSLVTNWETLLTL